MNQAGINQAGPASLLDDVSRRDAALDATEARDWPRAATLWQAMASDQPQDFEAQLRWAEALCFAGTHAEAARVARLAARLRPQDARPLLLLARAEMALDPQAGVVAWRAVLALAPQEFEAWARLAELQAQQGRANAALEPLVRALALQPAHPFALALAARVLGALPPRQRQDRLAQLVPAAAPDAGLALLHVAAQLDPQDMRAQSALASALLARHAHAQALPPLRALAQANPNAPDVLAELARTLHRAQHWAEAARAWRRLLLQRPKEAEAALRLAQALRQDGQAEAALRAAQQALAQHPEDGGLLREQARCLAELGRDTEADTAWSAALAAQPHDSALQLEHASHLLRQRRTEDALTTLDRLVGPAAGYDRASLLLLRLLQRRAPAEEVLARFATAIASGLPPKPDASALEVALRCGLLLLGRDRLREAAALIEPAHAAAPHDRLALRASLLLLLGRGEDAAARAQAERSLVALRQHGWAWQEVLGAFQDAEDTDFAIGVFQQAAGLFHDQPTEWLRIAEAGDRAQLGPSIVERLARLQPQQPEERLRASRLALREGALDLAVQLLGSAPPPTAQAEPWQRHCGLLALAQHLAGATPCDAAALADRVVARLCALAAARQPRAGWTAAGPVVLVHRSLAPGSAGRQIAITLRALAERLGPGRGLHLVCTRLTEHPERRFHLAAVAEAGASVTDLANQDAAAVDTAALSAEERDLLALLGPGLSNPVLKLYGAFLRLRPAVVHLWEDRIGAEGALAALLAGVPRIVLAAHSTRPHPHDQPGRDLAVAWRALAGLPHVALANSSAAGAADYAAWLNLPPGRIGVLRQGFDFDRLLQRATPGRAEALRAEHHIPSQAIVVGGVLRLAEVNRPLLWLAAAAAVARARPDVHFLMLGEGPLRAEIAALARQQGMAERLHLPGRVEAAPWLRVMDLAMLTSRAEGLPHVLVEAQALGRPVLTTSVGGAAETLLDGVTGHVVPEASADLPAALASQLLAMLANPAWLAEARQQARRFVGARFSAQALAQRTLELYGMAPPLAEGALPAWKPPPGEAEREAAAAAMQRQDWAAAQQAWDSLLLLCPADEDALLGAARTRLQQNLLADARIGYARALREVPGPEALRGMARTLRALREDREALPLWEALLQAAPRDREAMLRSAEAKARLGDLAGAIATAETARRLLGQDGQVIRLQARLQTEADNPAEALRHWNTLAEALPRDPEAQLQAGLAAQQTGDTALAERRLRAALLAPATPQGATPRAAAALAGLLADAARPHEARAALRHGLRLAPQDATLWRTGFTALQAAGRTGVVARCLSGQRRRAAGNPAARLAWADRLLAAGYAAAARQELTALAAEPEVAVAAADRLARAALRQADITAAAAASGQGIALPPATRQEVAVASRFATRLRAESGQPDPRLGFWTLAARAAQRRGYPRYLPQRDTVVHVVSARAADAAACAAAAMAEARRGSTVTVLRLEAAAPLAGLAEAGVAQASLVEHAATATAALAGLPELAVPPGLFGEALRPREVGRLAAALLALQPARVVLWSLPVLADAALAPLALGVPALVLRASGPPPCPPAEAAGAHLAACQPLLRTTLLLGNARLHHAEAAALAGWAAWLDLDAATAAQHASLPPEALP